jgi:hypothetical protein
MEIDKEIWKEIGKYINRNKKIKIEILMLM